MEIYTNNTTAIITALSPLSHGRIPGLKERNSTGENNILHFRTMPFLYKEVGSDSNYLEKDIYCVSGNAMRGLGRRLLFHHTFEDVLDLNFDAILKDSSVVQRRYVINLFENGGSTPKDSKSSGNVPAATYDKVLQDIPFLDLLGGVYITHHFDGSAVIGNLILRTKETHELLKKLFTDDDADQLPALEDIKIDTVRHTKRQSPRDASAFSSAEDAETKANLKSASIYGIDVLPAGSTFYWMCGLKNTRNKGTALAYKAMLALIARHGLIGGMTAKGYGMARFDFLDDLDIEKSIDEYDQYLRDNRDAVIEGIKLLAEDFKYMLKTADKKEKKDVKKDA